MFQPKCSPIGSHSAPVRHTAYPSRIPHATVLTIARVLTSRFPECISPKITLVGRMVANGPTERISNWKAYPRNSSSSPIAPKKIATPSKANAAQGCSTPAGARRNFAILQRHRDQNHTQHRRHARPSAGQKLTPGGRTPAQPDIRQPAAFINSDHHCIRHRRRRKCGKSRGHHDAAQRQQNRRKEQQANPGQQDVQSYAQDQSLLVGHRHTVHAFRLPVLPPASPAAPEKQDGGQQRDSRAAQRDRGKPAGTEVEGHQQAQEHHPDHALGRTRRKPAQKTIPRPCLRPKRGVKPNAAHSASDCKSGPTTIRPAVQHIDRDHPQQ